MRERPHPTPVSPVSISPGRPITRWLIIRRGFRVAAVTARHGIGHFRLVVGRSRFGRLVRLDRRPAGDRPERVEELVRMTLEDLGPTFVKLGQLLSMREDIVPPRFQVQLARLQDAAPPEPPGTVDAVLEAELGGRAADVFAEFDPEPLAAASIGQVHAAVLADGSEVVVKVRRPGALAVVEVDLTVLEWEARTASRLLPAARRFDVSGLITELARSLRAELDYTVEAANAERIAANFAGDERVHIPAVHRVASTSTILTLERIRGIKVSDLDALDAAGIDRPALAHRIVDVLLSMVFDHGFFHADPHPGNLFVEPDGRLGLVDFGMVGEIDPSVRAGLARLFVATATVDADALTDELLGLGVASGPTDRAALREDLAAVLDHITSVPLSDIRLGPMLQAELAVMRRHRLRFPTHFALLVKTAVTTESVATLLDPTVMLLPAFAQHAQRLTTPPVADELG